MGNLLSQHCISLDRYVDGFRRQKMGMWKQFSSRSALLSSLGQELQVIKMVIGCCIGDTINLLYPIDVFIVNELSPIGVATLPISSQ